MTTSRASKVLLIGWDGADWQMITPLLEAGILPSLEGLIERGVMGNLATLRPILSPILWTSIATGRRADAHGEPRPPSDRGVAATAGICYRGIRFIPEPKP